MMTEQYTESFSETEGVGMQGSHRTPADYIGNEDRVLTGVAVEVLYDPDDPSDAVLQMTIRSSNGQLAVAELPLTSVKAAKLTGQLADQAEQTARAEHVAAGGDIDTFVPAYVEPRYSKANVAAIDDEWTDVDEIVEPDDEGTVDGSAPSRGRLARIGDPGGLEHGVKRLATEMPPVMGMPGSKVIYGMLVAILLIAALVAFVV